MQYVFLNSAPGNRWRQNEPNSVTDALFREPLDAIGTPGTNDLRLGLAFILSYNDGALPTLEETLRRLLALSEKHDTPVLLALDGQNWWGARPDLWNWWDPSKPGYNPANRENVEWTDWGPEHAVKIGWRNWGRQIRVLPAPNIAAPRFREASQVPMRGLAAILQKWARRLPEAKRYLFPGVKVGWEASIGINAYYYPNGNTLLNADPAQDPTQGLKMQTDFAGGLVPLGYAALTSLKKAHPGPITLADHETIVAEYLQWLASICRRAGLKRSEIITHAGGQFAPWEKHYSHRVALNVHSVPGWSLYNHDPMEAGDLAATLARAKRTEWCAAEWLDTRPRTSAQWTDSYRRCLAFQTCRFVDVYNWEGIRKNPEALAGLRGLLEKT